MALYGGDATMLTHARFGLWLEHGLDIRFSWDVISVAMMLGANRACARSPKALRLITQPAEAWTLAKSLCVHKRTRAPNYNKANKKILHEMYMKSS